MSAPPPPVRTSLPSLPLRVLAKPSPVSVSLPLPRTHFDIAEWYFGDAADEDETVARLPKAHLDRRRLLTVIGSIHACAAVYESAPRAPPDNIVRASPTSVSSPDPESSVFHTADGVFGYAADENDRTRRAVQRDGKSHRFFSGSRRCRRHCPPSSTSLPRPPLSRVGAVIADKNIARLSPVSVSPAEPPEMFSKLLIVSSITPPTFDGHGVGPIESNWRLTWFCRDNRPYPHRCTVPDGRARTAADRICFCRRRSARQRPGAAEDVFDVADRVLTRPPTVAIAFAAPRQRQERIRPSCPLKSAVSDPAPPSMVSVPPPPLKMSRRRPPRRTLACESPVSTSATALPVTFSICAACPPQRCQRSTSRRWRR